MRGLALAIFLIACGGGGGSNDGNGDDAPPADASIDAPDAGPPPPTSIRVLVRQENGQVSPGVPIMFQRPDDSVIAIVMTNANGIASAMSPAFRRRT